MQGLSIGVRVVEHGRRVEAILGLNYLKNFKTTIDFEKGYLTIEPT